MVFNTNRNRKLSNYLINKEVQLKLFAANLFYIFLVVIITVAVTIYPIVGIMFKPGEGEAQYYATLIYLNIAGKLPFIIIAVMILFGINHIFLSHRICGPLVNFKNTFHRIACGDLTRRIRLRKKDFFTSEAEEINSMMDNLSTMIASVKAGHEQLVSKIENVNVDNKEGMLKSLEAAKSITKEVQDRLSVFKLAETVNPQKPDRPDKE